MRKWNKKTPEQLKEEGKKKYKFEIKRNIKHFDDFSKEDKLNYMLGRISLENWLIATGENNISIIQAEIKKIIVNIKKIKNLIKEEDFEGFKKEYFK